MITDKNRLTEMTEWTCAVLAARQYSNQEGIEVPLASSIEAAVDGTVLIRPCEWQGLDLAGRSQALRPPCEVVITDETAIQAIRRLSQAGVRVGVLNFTSALVVGGGWLRGAQAQEESLVRASALSLCLASCPAYYEENRENGSPLYTDHAIWSPGVPFFTDDEGNPLASPVLADVITMPAPFNGGITSEAETLAVPKVFAQRIPKVLALAASKGVHHLILGAWGCGAFGNYPTVVARCFRTALFQDVWRKCFGSIVFAIPGAHEVRGNHRVFSQELFPSRE